MSPALPWWTAWSWRQLANGCQTRIAVNRPHHLLARFEAQKDPWPQSWKTMNVRNKKPAAGMPRARITSTETWS